MLAHDDSFNPADASMHWHTLSTARTVQQLASDLERGLSCDEACRRLARDGRNDIQEQRSRSVLNMVVSQFRDFMIIVLILAAVVSGIIGDATDTLVIIAIVLLNGVVGFIQDFRAERAMASLRQLAALKAIVVRAGERQTISASEIVQGDIVLVETGSAIPADLRL
ncbi:cation-transporting P-type ATPase, partial [Caballeronia terrestris]